VKAGQSIWKFLPLNGELNGFKGDLGESFLGSFQSLNHSNGLLHFSAAAIGAAGRRNGNRNVSIGCFWVSTPNPGKFAKVFRQDNTHVDKTCL
jgi:hypothetical protein